jgi:RNA polymerase sigma-70 factor, ECF subfamily
MVRRARRDDARQASRAFDALYRREVGGLVALATSLTGDAGRGAELAQEALLRTFQSWDSVAQLDRPGAWTRRVLINLTIDAERRRRNEVTALMRVASAREVQPVDRESDQFWAAVRALPERQRHAVALHYLDDMSVADVAHVLEVTEGTVKTSLHMARRHLAAALGATHGAPSASTPIERTDGPISHRAPDATEDAT